MGDGSGRDGISRREVAKLGLGLGLMSAAGAGKAAESYETILEAMIMVPMRDGIRLATDVYRPALKGKAVPGPFPVILERTPYGRNIVSRSELSVAEPKPKSRAEVGAFFARRGYVVIYQDCRGRYDSEGEFVKYLSDGNDGYDCCKWIVAQPWCNGKIGTMGLSYAAHTQGALGCTNPPGIAAMFLDSGGFSNSYQGGIRQGGAFELKQVTWGFNNAIVSPAVQNDPVRLAEMKAIDLRAWFARMPWKRGHSPLAPALEYENYVYDQWEHGNFDGYWKQIGIYAAGYYDQFSDAPMVHMSAWYDPYPRTATENYIGLKARKKGPIRLILGPWTHGDRSRTYAGDVDFGPAATLDGNLAPDYLSLRLRWFDAWLKGEPNGVAEEPPVRIFVMGGGSGRRNAAGRLDHGGRWRAEKDWPIPDARNMSYHLHEYGLLAPEPPAAATAPLTFDFDPAHPVPTIGGTVTSGAPVMVGGGLRPDRRATLLRLARALSSAGRPPRRAGFRDACARSGHRNRRADRGSPLDFVRPARYRHHRQADRRLPIVSRLSPGLCHEPDRWHPAAPLSQFLGEARDAAAGRTRCSDGGDFPYRQSLQARAPHPARYLVEQLSSLRRQPEHRRTRGQGPVAAGGPQQHLCGPR